MYTSLAKLKYELKRLFPGKEVVMQKSLERNVAENRKEVPVPLEYKPFLLGQHKNCADCQFKDQDLDAYPCASCRLRPH